MEAVSDAVTALFAERGPDALTVREVADRAGVEEPAIRLTAAQQLLDRAR